MSQAENGGLRAGDRLHGFEITDVRELEEFKAVGISARHTVTGLEVFHLLTDDEENLFAYAFMTPPEDSTGVAHILEHSVLCGSKNYPIKDPFLVLAKQSVKTFLNAMTFPDKTVYPASSMVEADYFNLMSVYGDAVFFPLLEEWVFRQEGHRFEFAPDGGVSVQGVVFNEMKGNYSSFDSIAGDWTLRSLLEGTVYGHDSGGDPAEIPSLTYERFRAFHERYYHPVNCRVFLSGNIPTGRQLALLQDRFLSRFNPATKPPAIGAASRRDEPKSFRVPAPAGDNLDLSKETVELNWLLPCGNDTVSFMEANLLTEILLGHDGAPLSRALLDSGLGEDLAPSSGLETEILHLCFSVGLRGVPSGSGNAFEKIVLDTLASLADGGIPEDELETAIRSIDFSNREVRRSGGPFALTLMRRSLRGWIHGRGPIESLRQVPAFEEVKRRIAADPGYLKGLLSSWLIDNRHRALVSVYPDPEYGSRLDAGIAARVDAFSSGLTEDGRKAFIEEQERLYAIQKREDSPELLARIPHLSPKDLPVVADLIPSDIRMCGKVPLILHEQPTNGVAYADIAIPVDVLEADDYPLLPFFANILTGMGLDGLSWAEASSHSARLTGGLGTMLFTSSAVRGYVPPEGLSSVSGARDFLIVRIKMLEELIEPALELLFRFLEHADFSDSKRLTDLLFEYRNDLESSLAPAGNQYAVSRAGAATGRSKAVDEIWNGFSQLRFIRDLSARMKDAGFVASLAGRLDAMRNDLLGAGMLMNITGTETILAALESRLSVHTARYSAPASPSASSGDETVLGRMIGEPGEGSFRILVSASLQVGFAAAVLPCIPYNDPDHPVYAVLGHWLSSGPLWEKIRTTGGAYGAFSYPDSLEDLFVLATYRDPSPLQSLSVFRAVLEEASIRPFDPLSLEKTITGCYSREIQPRSPSDKGFTAFIRLLYGITDEVRKAKVSRIVSVQPAEMQACAKRLADSWKDVKEVVLAGDKMIKGDGKQVFSGNVVRMIL